MRIQTQVKSFAQDHTAFKRQNQNVNSGCLAVKLLPFSVAQEPLAHYQLPDATSRALAVPFESMFGCLINHRCQGQTLWFHWGAGAEVFFQLCLEGSTSLDLGVKGA